MISNPHIIEKLKKLADLGYPFNGTIELTSRCNIFCEYCFIDRKVRELETSEVKTVIDRLDQAGVCTLLITGGEPFIREDILEILSYIFKKNFFEIYIFSNGTLLTKKEIEFLADHAKLINLFRISFFSHIPEIHDRFVGVNGSFHKALRTARALLSSGVRTGILLNAISQNLKTIENSREYFNSLGFKVQTGKNKILSTAHIRECFAETVSEEFYTTYYKGIGKKAVEDLKRQLEEQHELNRASQCLCEGLFGLISIRSDGSITPCLTFRNLSLGNIVTDQRPLREIYTSSEIYHTLKKIKRSDIQKCKGCAYTNICVVCPGIMHTETGGFSEPSPMFCNNIKALDKVILPQNP